ncbi:MAG: YegS/Rv2252/BmrU family lipid kinase [Melioribacteraceae bacterium]|nr:YegS/Rv2252/BmrU family lipid kinase [Melioribacteraceae bacterium]
MNNLNKYLFLINPVAGNGSGLKFFRNFRDVILSNSGAKIILTEYPDHATEIIDREESNFTHIFVCGGDGTFNEAINGLKNFKTNIGLIPVGSGNDFIKNFPHISNLSVFLNDIFSDNLRISKCDIACVTLKDAGNNVKSRKFANSCGIGFDAYVAYLNQNNKKLKGKFSYIYSIFKALIKLKIFEIEALNAGKSFRHNVIFMAIGNGKTAGGGLYLTPDAQINDCFLNYTIIQGISRLNLIRHLPKAFNNKLKNYKDAIFGKFNEISIKLNHPYYVHADGECVSDNCIELKIQVLCNKLNFISN